MFMDRYVCIHGHFYQPPRENPWLEAIERQDSAYPYHDWNERITAECYAPNGRSRVLDGEGRITRLVNNYAKISFNVGPTLLSWMAAHAPDAYALVLEADRLSRARFGGHGSALAQVYNHIIMPLANRRDKLTQIRWGKADFARRFGRPPEGMWLPETAVDLETLDLLAQEGIKFTVLSPHQARRARPRDSGAGDWQDVTGGRIDPTRAYECLLPTGRSVALFFYDGPVAQAVAFGGLLHRGEELAGRLVGAFRDDRPWAQLVHVATDGETYGHHWPHGDMALAYALECVERQPGVRLTNYGQYLELHPPAWAAEVHENSAWSCAHGLGRWQSHCGCGTGRPGWTQNWRGPLRAALDWLRDALAPVYEAEAGKLLHDPWAARDGYIDVLLDRGPESVDDFLRRHAGRGLAPARQVRTLKLLEMQRNCLLMYTSCGWFFDELSGIETVQVIQYAGRAVQLAEELTGGAFEADFVKRLALARSNLPHLKDGRGVYERFVKPARVDLAKVAAHYAVSSLFHDYPRRARVYCFAADSEGAEAAEIGRARLVLGRARVTSEVTRESGVFEFAAVHFGDVNLHGGVRPHEGKEAEARRRKELAEAFGRFDMAEVLRLLDRHFAAAAHSLRSLFRDEQSKVLARITEATTEAMEAAFRYQYATHAPVMLVLQRLGRPALPAFQRVADFLVNLDLRRAFEAEAPDLGRVRKLWTEAELFGVALDTSGLAFALKGTVARALERVAADPDDVGLVRRAEELVTLAGALSFAVDLGPAQNTYYRLLQTAYAERLARAAAGDDRCRVWAEAFAALGDALRVGVPREIVLKLDALAS
jgi:alpha-amylase/alpha-mannosidase (GH57 family)